MKIKSSCQNLFCALFCTFLTQVSAFDCNSVQKKCPDGSCVSMTSRCPGECFAWQRKCPNGMCVDKMVGQCLGECARWERRCQGGKCVSKTKPCPYVRCEWYEKRCPDGSCVRDITSCPGECRAGQKKCKDGSCRYRCPGECSSWQKKCPDGRCVSRFSGRCPGECSSGEKKCPDGRCVGRTYGRCPGECKYGQKKCSDGSCVDKYTERCFGGSCPSGRPIGCSGSKKCISRYRKCDSNSDCPQGEDEKGCASSMSNWWYFLLIPVFFFILICMCIYKCCKYKSAAGRLPANTTRGTRATGATTYSRTPMASAVWSSPSRPRRTNTPTGSNVSLSNIQYRPHFEPGDPVSGAVTPSAPSEPAPGAPPSYDMVVLADQYNVPSAPKQGLPSYDQVADIPPGTMKP